YGPKWPVESGRFLLCEFFATVDDIGFILRERNTKSHARTQGQVARAPRPRFSEKNEDKVLSPLAGRLRNSSWLSPRHMSWPELAIRANLALFGQFFSTSSAPRPWVRFREFDLRGCDKTRQNGTFWDISRTGLR